MFGVYNARRRFSPAFHSAKDEESMYLHRKHSTGKKAKSQIDRGNEKERKNLFTPLDVGLPGIAGLVHRKGLGGWLVLSGLLVNKAWADDERQPPVPVVTYVIIFFSLP